MSIVLKTKFLKIDRRYFVTTNRYIVTNSEYFLTKNEYTVTKVISPLFSSYPTLFMLW